MIHLSFQAPRLNPYPGPWSVVIMDNCAIHHDEEIRQIIEVECGMYSLHLSSQPTEGLSHKLQNLSTFLHTLQTLIQLSKPFIQSSHGSDGMRHKQHHHKSDHG